MRKTYLLPILVSVEAATEEDCDNVAGKIDEVARRVIGRECARADRFPDGRLAGIAVAENPYLDLESDVYDVAPTKPF